MKPDDRALALKAHRLLTQNITGVEMARRLKVASADHAHELAVVGGAIAAAEARRLTQREMQAMKAIVRMLARDAMVGMTWTTLSRVDFALRKRSGWTGSTIAKRLQIDGRAPPTDIIGLVARNDRGHAWLTPAGWAFAWQAGLIKRNWKVPA